MAHVAVCASRSVMHGDVSVGTSPQLAPHDFAILQSEIDEYASQHGAAAAVRHFSRIL